MEQILLLVAVSALMLALGITVGFVAARHRHAAVLATLRTRVAGLGAELERADAELVRSREDAAVLRTENDAFREAERERAEQQSSAREQDHRVLEAIAPVRQQLELMQRTVMAMEEQRNVQHGELAEQLRAQHASELRLHEVTGSLASALRNNATRGSWGEAQLRNIVEAAGLVERVDFVEQLAVQTEAGKGRPDLVVHLPGGAQLAVDAKAPLADYLAASELSATGSEAEQHEREQRLMRHARAVRGHVDALAKRNYASAFRGSPEFVICFIPSEAALSAALAQDASLLEDAFAEGIALTSPVSLWSTLKAVASSWRHEQLTESAEEVIALGAQLTRRLATTAGHLDKLGRSINATVGAYNQAIGSIESRVLPSARKLAALEGVAEPAAPQSLDETTRTLSARELTEALELANPPVQSRREERAAG